MIATSMLYLSWLTLFGYGKASGESTCGLGDAKCYKVAAQSRVGQLMTSLDSSSGQGVYDYLQRSVYGEVDDTQIVLARRRFSTTQSMQQQKLVSSQNLPGRSNNFTEMLEKYVSEGNYDKAWELWQNNGKYVDQENLSMIPYQISRSVDLRLSYWIHVPMENVTALDVVLKANLVSPKDRYYSRLTWSVWAHLFTRWNTAMWKFIGQNKLMFPSIHSDSPFFFIDNHMSPHNREVLLQLSHKRDWIFELVPAAYKALMPELIASVLNCPFSSPQQMQQLRAETLENGKSLKEAVRIIRLGSDSAPHPLLGVPEPMEKFCLFFSGIEK
ncbi:hypothetical protein MIR68_012377 [Amoeboaphelidium protococcarum]|nr:hypothetical protein MIR68_012377 [Amoeboaphelidium protococcarum]